MKQNEQIKLREIVRRRNAFWLASERLGRVRSSLPERRAFFAGASLNGILQAPVLEIGAEYAVNGLILEGEMGLPMASVDLSGEALQGSTILSRLLGYQPPSLRVAGDAERLPFANGSFRTVVLWNVLRLFDNPVYLFNEIHRVMTPDGYLIIGDEPIHRAFRFALGETPPSDRLHGWHQLLLKLYLLPWFYQVCDEENHYGPPQREFRFGELNWLLRRFTRQDWSYQPRLPGGAYSAGPMARWLWRNLLRPGRINESLTRWFGGRISGWVQKPTTIQAISPGHYLVRKHPRHDHVALRGFTGAFQCQGETLRAESETVALPKSTRGRSMILLNIPREPLRIELFSSNGEARLISHPLTDTSEPPEPQQSLACPDCVVFTDSCIFGRCENQCVQACPRNALSPTDPVMPVNNNCDGCGLCLHACPYGGLDRPLLEDGRCPECRRHYPRDRDIVELRPKVLQNQLNQSRWEEMLRF